MTEKTERRPFSELRKAQPSETVAKSATGALLAWGKSATVADRATEPLSKAPVAKKATVAESATITVPEKDGYTRVPHTITDNLLRLLEPAEQLVYLRLYRLIYGYKNRDEITVAYETLAQACNLGKRTVVRAVEGLVAKGLVTYEAVISGPRGERGNRYRLPGASVVKKATVAKTATVVATAPMKEISKESHENAEMKRRALEHEFRARNPQASDGEIARAVDEAMTG